jgi:hypothetical protein
MSDYDDLQAVVRGLGWELENNAAESVLVVHFEGRGGPWLFAAHVDEALSQLVAYSVVPTPVPADALPAISEFVIRVNHGLSYGNLELDLDDGQLRFRTSLDYEGNRLTEALVRPVLVNNCGLIDHLLPAIHGIVQGDLTPAAALERVEESLNEV